MTENESLSGEQKTFVALAAAMGGGCRTCAERLYGIAQSLDMDEDEIDRALCDGLEVRGTATRLMRDKVRSLHEGEAEVAEAEVCECGEGIRKLARLAAAVAANAGPAALVYAEAARAAGASEGSIGVAAGIGRTIRSKAQMFSDGEFAAAGVGDGAEEPCSAEAEVRADARAADAACGCEDARSASCCD